MIAKTSAGYNVKPKLGDNQDSVEGEIPEPSSSCRVESEEASLS